MKTREYVRYSDAFKLQVVSEVQSGKYRSMHDAQLAFGIKGGSTIGRWIKMFGNAELLPKHVTITTMNERDERKELRKRVQELEKALAETHMRGLLNESFLEIACEKLDTDPELFKKKHVLNPSAAAKRKAGK